MLRKAFEDATPLETQPMNMRDATEEERKSVKDYIESVSKPTGVQFEAQPTDAKETIIKSALKYLVKMQIEEGSAGFAVDNDHDHDCCWDDVLAWIEAQPCENAVSREAVLDIFNEWFATCNIADKRESPKAKINALPPVKPTSEDIKEAYLKGYDYGVKDWFRSKTQPSEDCISREEIKEFINTMLTSNEEMGSIATNEGRWVEEKMYLHGVEILEGLDDYVKTMPPVKPKYTDEEIDKIQAVEQTYVDKMVELAVEEVKRPKGKWIGEKPYPICDKCGCNIYEEYISCSDFAEIYKPMNYCPNCGAEMRGGEEYED